MQSSVDELVARRREFDALVAPHLPALRMRATRLCGLRYDSDDVVQEALLRAFLATKQVNDLTCVAGWLLTIVTHTFIDLTRARKHADHLPLVADVPAPEPIEPGPWDHIDANDLRAAVDCLSDDVRDTYRMFALEGRNYTAISEALNIPAATVGSRLFRARKQLRILLTSGSSKTKVRRKSST